MTQTIDKKESQSEKFRRLAREVEADEDERAFKDKLGKIARPKPSEKDDKDK